MIKWHIGCSGFYYKHWKNIFYPEGMAQSKWFDYYAQHYKSLELNGTFYRAPTAASLKKWYDTSPPDFSFAVKAPQGITHYKKFNGAGELIERFYGIVEEGLKEKLGVVLFQLPPNFVYTEVHLAAILNDLDPSFTNVVEFRHDSWWTDDVYQKLAEKNISFCGISHPTLPDAVIQNTPSLYFRFHGVEHLYSSEYSIENLVRFVQLVKNTSAQKAFVYFNNDIGGAAVKNAEELIRLAADKDFEKIVRL